MFADVLPTAAAALFIETAACPGVLGGYSCAGAGEPCDSQYRPYFRPAQLATRGQVAQILYSALTTNNVCNSGPKAP